MTISLRTLLLAAAALVVAGVVAFVAVSNSTHAAPVTGAVAPAAAPAAARLPTPAAPARPQVPETPIGTVGGSTPGTKLTLLSLGRTGPKVVTARLEISYDGDPEDGAWVPSVGDDGLSAENMRLVDEVNGREHFVLRNADGECLCSGEFEPMWPGESSVISATPRRRT
jgi:hypothetical protein